MSEFGSFKIFSWKWLNLAVLRFIDIYINSIQSGRIILRSLINCQFTPMVTIFLIVRACSLSLSKLKFIIGEEWILCSDFSFSLLHFLQTWIIFMLKGMAQSTWCWMQPLPRMDASVSLMSQEDACRYRSHKVDASFSLISHKDTCVSLMSHKDTCVSLMSHKDACRYIFPGQSISWIVILAACCFLLAKAWIETRIIFETVLIFPSSWLSGGTILVTCNIRL